MVYKAVESENGEYRNNEGILFDILEATNVMTPQGLNVGWSEYASLEEAAAGFDLTYVGPQEENEDEEIVDILSAILSEEVNK